MSKKSGFLAVRIMLVLGVSLIFILWAAAQYSSGDDRLVSGPEDLRRELWRAQSLSLPQNDFPVFVDAGDFIFVGGTDDGAALADGLVPVAGADGAVRWPVTVYEDPLTLETVFLNADGDEVGRLQAPPGYDPAWVLDAAFPQGVPEGADASGYDPSRVVMTANLLAPGGEGGTGAGIAGEGLRGAAGGDAGEDADNASMVNVQKLVRDTEPIETASVNGTLYADSDIGNALYDGYSQTALSASQGPKATVQQAIDASISGDIIEIRGQAAFSDTMIVPGSKNVRLRPIGNVRF